MKSSAEQTNPLAETNANSRPAHDRSESVSAGLVRTGCPTPLSCADVLEEFRDQSVPWSLDRGDCIVSGRTWGTGPAVYFLNGAGGTHQLFVPVVWLLRKNVRCVVYDYPGGKPARVSLTAERLAEDLLAVANAQGDETFACYAASFGGLVALAAMRLSPERITRAMIQNGFAYRHLTRFERLLIRIGRRWPGSLDRVPGYRSLLRQNHAMWFPPFDPGRWQFFLYEAGRVPVAELAGRAAVIRDTDLRPHLAKIKQPVVLIGTEGEGRVNRLCRAELADVLPNAAVEILPDSGQLPCLTQPHRMAKLISSFLLAEHDPGTPPL